MKKWITLLEQLYCRFIDDEVTALGAQLTYYLILSMFPFLIFVLTLISLTPITREQVLENLIALMPESSHEMVIDIVVETVKDSSNALLSAGMLGTIWTASSGVMALFRGINKAYDAEENRPFWKVRLFAIWYMLVFAFLLFLTLVLLVFGEIIVEKVAEWIPLPVTFQQVWPVVRLTIPFVMMIVVFAVLYKQAPNYKVNWIQALPGALFSTCLWIGTSLVFSYYVENFANYSGTYGSIGGIIVLLIWLYISSIVVILGGEVNAALQFMQEGKKKPDCKRFGFQLPLFGKKR